MVKKAVVLARGLGTRMQKEREGVELDDESDRIARQGLKTLIPVRGRPFLDFIIASLLTAGLRDICLVVAPDCETLKDYAEQVSSASDATVTWAVQEEALGTADAVLAAESFAGDDSFVLCNSDNLYPREALSMLAKATERGCCVAAFNRDSLVTQGNIARDRVRDMAVVVADDNGNLVKIIEKPPEPEEYARDGQVWVNMNLYRFSPDIFDACRTIDFDPRRGELELTSAVQLLCERGNVPFRVAFSDEGVLDMTSREDVPAVREALQDRQPGFPATSW